MSTEENQQNKYKRKRKKTFLQNARKYAKKGYYGRGSRIEADTYQYFVGVLEAYKGGFPSEEEKVLFVNNVFNQTENTEIECCTNQVGCRVVEMLLPFANDQVMARFMDRLCDDLRPLCSDRFATHVIEALLTESCRRSLTESVDTDFREKYKSFTLKISKFMLNNLEDFVWDMYGNHIIRTVLINLSNMPKEENSKFNNSEENKKEKLPVLDEYLDIVKEYGERILSWPQFKDLAYSEKTSGLLQILLKALKENDLKLLKRYLKKLLEESFLGENEDEGEVESQKKLPQVFMSKPALMLLETALQVAKSKMYTQIYAKCFTNNLVALAKMRNTNFAVQKLLTHCRENVEFESMFEELEEHFKEIIKTGHSGVLLALGQSCKRLSARQGSYIQNLMKAFDCFDPVERQNDFVLCLSKFLTYEELKKTSNESIQKDKLNLHGTLIVQLLLEFNKPIKVVNSILNMEPSCLKNLFSNSMGSHITDSYVKSNFVGEKSRDKLVKKLKRTYQDLASTKYGSRSFEAIWNVCHIKNRLLIMEELNYKDGIWSNSEFGRIISNKINLALYKRNKEEWKNSINKTDKIKLLLEVLE